MLHPLPQPHSSTVRPTADPSNRQPTRLEYTSSLSREPYHHFGSGIPSSPVNADSPTVSQPTTPRPTPQSVTQPSSPRDGPLLMNTNIRRKRRESDYTSDTPTFGVTHYRGNVYATDKSTVLDVQIQSKVDRGFFLADNDWTCYRRNYFQTSSSFSLQGVVVLYEGQELPCLVKDQDELHPVDQFYIGISARLSDCSKPISLIQHTAKRDKGPQTTPEPRVIRPGGNLSFSSVGANQSIVTFERIQFKSATANNGKRRAAQQYYVVVMELLCKIRNSDKLVLVASTDSQPLVVRGRSPGHYAESHGSSKITPDTTGGPMRRSFPALTSPMIPGHHPTTFGYASSDYPSYDYPPHGNVHYAYAPHAGVPMAHSPYDYHHHHHLPPPPPHIIQPPRQDPVYDHYLPPPPMHRSESAPSTSDHHFHSRDDDRWTRARMQSTPDHPTSSFLPHPHEHHAFYNTHQPYYHPPPHLPPPGGRQGYHPSSSSPSHSNPSSSDIHWRSDPRSRMEIKPEL